MENFLNFCKTNCFYIEIGLLVLFVVFAALYIISLVKRKHLSGACDRLNEEIHDHENEIMKLKSDISRYDNTSKDNIKTIQYLTDSSKELTESIEAKNKEIEGLNDKLTLSKNDNDVLISKVSELETKVADTEASLKEKENNCAEKDLKIIDLTKRNEAANKLVTDLDASVKKFEERSKVAETKAESVSTDLTILTKEHTELQKKYDDIIKENENLKDLEVENRVLLRTIKRLQEESEKPKKSEMRILNETNKEENEEKLSYIKVNNMTRSELFDTAKKFGFTNYALWSNEKLRTEIKSKL